MPYRMSPEDLDVLRSALNRQKETLSFKDDPKLCSLIASVGLQREFGTINDEMARFVFDADTGEQIPREKIRSELVRYRGNVGVRVWAIGLERLELRVRGVQALLHPHFSYREDGSLSQCVFFPESIAKILALEGIDPVVVRDWGMNTLFGGFDPSQHYYQTNFWELENNDTLRFAKLLENRRIPFLGTHDLIAHIAGAKDSAWGALAKKSSTVRAVVEDYLGDIRVPTIASLVIPYTVGVLLDDLAQPPSYDAPGRHIVIDEGLRVIESRKIDPAQPRVLLSFPKAYEKAILLARDPDLSRVQAGAKRIVDAMVAEIQGKSVAFLNA